MKRPPLDRNDFDFDGVTWLLHCAEGPTPVEVARAAAAYMEHEARPWTRNFVRDVIDVLADARAQAAALISNGNGRTCDQADITLSQSTSSGLTLVARGFDFKPGDEVLAPLGEFPSNVWPWKALADRGVTFREAPLWDGQKSGKDAWDSVPPSDEARPEGRLAAAIGPRTRIVTASWVRFQDGLMLDPGLLGRLCAERGVPLVVDGIQGAGTHVPDLTNVAAFATGGHKGLLAMSGQGFLWTDRDFRSRLSPVGSWLSVEEGGNFDRAVTDLERGWMTTGQRLEQGGYNILGSLVLGGSLKVINHAGVKNIQAHVGRLQDRLIEKLKTAGGKVFDGNAGRGELDRLDGLARAGRLGPIVAIHHMGKGQGFLDELASRLADNRIFVSTREGYLRLAFHGWHDENDIGAVIDALTTRSIRI